VKAKVPFPYLQQHPNRRLQSAWNYAQIGLLILPLWTLPGIVLLCFACLKTWRQQYQFIIHRPLNWGLVGFSFWLVITTVFARYQQEALIGLSNFLPYFLIFAGYSALIQTAAQLRRLAWILVITSVPVVIIGLGQLFWGWVGHIQLLWIVLDWIIAPTGNPPGRMASVFMYANTLSGYLVVAFSLGLGLWIENLPMSAKSDRGYAWLRCGFLSVVVIGNLVALILTDSRNAWAIAAVTGLAFAIYQGWRLIVAGVAIAVGSVLGAAFGPLPLQHGLRAVIPAFFWARLTDQLYPNRSVPSLRKTQWEFAWALTGQHPWLGWGLRNFTPLYKAQMHEWLGHPHNFLFMLTAEIGIPGAIFFCGWVSWIIVQGLQSLHNWQEDNSFSSRQLVTDKLIFFSYLVAFFACILCNTVDVTVFDARLNSIGWLLLSAICGVAYYRQEAETNI